MPNYNHSKVIVRAVESLQCQTKPVDEIIIVDDGSVDNSVAVIEGLQARDPRIQFVRHERNRGAVTAINSGLAKASGTYVHFAAADDVFRPELMATTFGLLEANKAAALACGEVETFQAVSRMSLGYRPPARPSFGPRYFSAGETKKLLKRIDNFILTAATLFRRADVLSVGGFDEALGSFTDGYLVRQLALKHGFCYTPQVLAEWWIDDKGYSRTSIHDPNHALRLLQDICARQRSDPTFPDWYPDLFARRWRFAVARIAAQSEPPSYGKICEVANDPALETFAKLVRLLPSGIARVLVLAAMAIRWHPTSYSALLRTWTARRLKIQ